MRNAVALGLCLAAWQAGSAAPAPEEQGASLSHAYYPFVIEPSAPGADVVIPLLLTRMPIEQLEKSTPGKCDCSVIWTYERDSVVALEDPPGLDAIDIRVPERHVRLPASSVVLGRPWYRYQRVSFEEVRLLVTRPEGIIPVHRMGVPKERLDKILAALPNGG